MLTMRKQRWQLLNYVLLSPIGLERLYRTGSVSDLVRETPYLIYLGVIPPLHILNQVLQEGRQDAGMSGGAEWQPFQITEQEFIALVEDLESYPGKSYRFVQPPIDLAEYDDWWRWVLSLREQNQ